MSTVAILLAGGAGSRVRRSENKAYLPVGDRPLMTWSLEALQQSPLIDEIVLVIRPDDLQSARQALGEPPVAKLRAMVEGGASRHASEDAALRTLADDIEGGAIDLVLIHDAARPFLSQELIDRVVSTARRCGGAVPALPLEGHVVREAGDGPVTGVGVVSLRRVQTPQAFWAPELLDAYRAAAERGFSGVDTSESVTAFSDLHVEAVPGDPQNLKVTFVEDLFTAEELAPRWRAERR